MTPNTVSILLVEDDDIDAATVERGLARARIANPLVRARDGVEALDILLGRNGQARLPQPYIILVDIRMPRMDGLSMVREIRATPELRRSVIFVLTTSDSERDRLAAYESHVAGYIVKSEAQEQFLHMARLLEYYLLIVSPPPAA